MRDRPFEDSGLGARAVLFILRGSVLFFSLHRWVYPRHVRAAAAAAAAFRLRYCCHNSRMQLRSIAEIFLSPPYFSSSASQRHYYCCCCCLRNNRAIGETLMIKKQLFAIVWNCYWNRRGRGLCVRFVISDLASSWGRKGEWESEREKERERTWRDAPATVPFSCTSGSSLQSCVRSCALVVPTTGAFVLLKAAAAALRTPTLPGKGMSIDR